MVIQSISPPFSQFSKNEDFGQYPRQREMDIAKLAAAGVEAVFEPESLYITGAVRCPTHHARWAD